MASAIGGAGSNTLSYFNRIEDATKSYQYDLDLSRLDDDKCHMIFPEIGREEQVIATFVEHSLFPPSDPILNAKFDYEPFKIDGLMFLKCSFPKSCRARVEFIAKQFFPYLIINSDSRLIRYPKKSSDGRSMMMRGIHFPASSKLLMFSGERKLSGAAFYSLVCEILAAAERIGFCNPAPGASIFRAQPVPVAAPAAAAAAAAVPASSEDPTLP